MEAAVLPAQRVGVVVHARHDLVQRHGVVVGEGHRDVERVAHDIDGAGRRIGGKQGLSTAIAAIGVVHLHEQRRGRVGRQHPVEGRPVEVDLRLGHAIGLHAAAPMLLNSTSVP